MIAYTLGKTESYDRYLKEDPNAKKLGTVAPNEEFPQGYEGGWVWRTPQEAEYFQENHLKEFFSTIDTFSIYQLDLPGEWGACTKPGENCSHLTVDATIVGKIYAPRWR